MANESSVVRCPRCQRPTTLFLSETGEWCLRAHRTSPHPGTPGCIASGQPRDGRMVNVPNMAVHKVHPLELHDGGQNASITIEFTNGMSMELRSHDGEHSTLHRVADEELNVIVGLGSTDE